jgi:hypothetical protein
MNINQILPWISSAILLVIIFFKIFQKPKTESWIWPLLASLVFLVYSAFTISVEGPLGFWAHHTMDFWGNQIWFDLIIGIATAFLLLLERLKAQKMNPVLWLLLILAGGSIGLLAMVSRLLYLEAGKTEN